MKCDRNKPGFALSLLTIAVTLAILLIGTKLSIPTIILLLIDILLLMALCVFYLHIPYRDVEKGMLGGIREAIITPLILMCAGMLIAAWIQCGTVPMLIYYGLGWLDVQWVLPISFLLCAVLCSCIGSSWSTAGTVGIACVSVGVSMGIPVEVMVGAVLSGAIFGDKLSPISDTTILASSTSDINIFSHVKAMSITAIPTLVLCFIGYYLVGLHYSHLTLDMAFIEEIRTALASNFTFSILLLVPLVMIAVMSLMKVPAIPTLLIPALTGAFLAVFLQGDSISTVMTALNKGYAAQTGIGLVDTMLSKGGIQSMLSTMATVIIALGLGGVLKAGGFLEPVVFHLTKNVRSDRGLILTTILTGLILVSLVPTFTVVMVLMGDMFRSKFDERDIHRSMLSRSMEDSTTLVLPFIPWNASCVYYMGLFALTDFSFAPYTFFCWGNILVSVIFTCLGLFIRKVRSPEEKLSGTL
nr:Na+/H+ antiporter NhaC [uncultured Oscillibacter sp.]